MCVGDLVHLKKGCPVLKGIPAWSDPLRVVEVLKNAVCVEDGSVWNFNRISLYKNRWSPSEAVSSSVFFDVTECIVLYGCCII